MNINLDRDSAEMVAWLASETGLTPSAVVQRLMGSHLPELWELRTFLETCPKGSQQYERAANLLISYGPESILEGLRQLDPDHVTLDAQFQQELHFPMSRLGRPQ
jgi:hypothetical protein